MKKFKPTSSIVAVDGGSTAEKSPPGYGTLLDQISTSFVAGQTRAIRAVNASATETYWKIGRHIVEFEQKGKIRADYGSRLLDRLSCDLRLRHGKGFSRSNIVYMRMLYLAYEKRQTLSDELSWSHYIELLQIDDPLERDFYLHQSAAEKWSLRELRRQIKSALFLRLAASKDKRAILRLAQKGQEIGKPADIIKSPLIFEFLNIPQNSKPRRTPPRNRANPCRDYRINTETQMSAQAFKLSGCRHGILGHYLESLFRSADCRASQVATQPSK
jgi:hypothetical protein